MPKRNGKKARTAGAAIFEALGHPIRRRVLGAMLAPPANQPQSPKTISKRLDLPLSNVSYHVRVLAECGAVSLINAKPIRGSIQHFYAVSPEFMSVPWAEAVLRSFGDER